jgi:succinoglycan biosynthesis transport protein ExoP
VHQTQTGTLRDYLGVVRRRKWIVLSALLVLPAVAILLTLRQEPEYKATSKVLLSRQNLAAALTGTPDSSLSLQPERLVQTQAEVARAPELADRVVRRAGYGSRSGRWLLRHSSVTPKSDADILVFDVVDDEPAVAARLATAYAREFTLYRTELDTLAVSRAHREVIAKLRDLESRGEQSAPLYETLLDKEQQLSTLQTLQTANASVVRRADGAARVGPRPVRNGVLALVLALVAGLTLAFARESLDTRVRTAEEIAERLGVPLLARLPAPPRKLKRGNGLIMVDDPRSAEAEAFRMLRTNVSFARLGRDIRTVIITSALEQEGKSTTVANLAIAMAREGTRVVLVDLDLRKPSIADLLKIENRPGITDVALGHASLDEATVPYPIGDLAPDGAPGGIRATLQVLPAGTQPPDAGEFVGTRALADALDELAVRADIVLIDTPPMLHVGDAIALAGRVDALLLVTRAHAVRRPMLNEVRRLLDVAPTQKLGFVLTGAGDETTYGYGYGHSYGGYGRPAPRGHRELVEERAEL